jgi:hypothetical protein
MRVHTLGVERRSDSERRRLVEAVSDALDDLDRLLSSA